MPKIELTPRKAAQYRRGHGLHCPLCGSTDLHVGATERDDNWITLEVSCHCGAAWKDLYKLAGVLAGEITTP